MYRLNIRIYFVCILLLFNESLLAELPETKNSYSQSVLIDGNNLPSGKLGRNLQVLNVRSDVEDIFKKKKKKKDIRVNPFNPESIKQFFNE